MADDDDVTVTLEPEETTGTEGETVKVEAHERAAPQKPKREAKPTAEATEQFKAMQAERDRERQRAERAERQAVTERSEREKLGREVTAAQELATDREADSIATGIAAAQTEAEAASAEYKSAFEAGDAGAMATAQRKMARAEARAVRLDEAKSDLEARREAAKTKTTERTEAPQHRQPASPTENFDGYLSQFTQPTADWLREHKDWVTDPRKNSKLVAAHHNALGDGLAADTPEYFEHVETFIGLRKQEEEPEPEPKKAATNGAANGTQQRKRASAPVAPGSASGGGMSGSGGNEVRLTRKEVESATDGTLVHNYDDPSPQKRFKKGDPIGVQEFARRKLQMTKQGVYDKTYVEQ